MSSTGELHFLLLLLGEGCQGKHIVYHCNVCCLERPSGHVSQLSLNRLLAAASKEEIPGQQLRVCHMEPDCATLVHAGQYFALLEGCLQSKEVSSASVAQSGSVARQGVAE